MHKLTVLFSAPALALFAQPINAAPSVGLESYNRARAVIQRAVAAIGGETTLRQLHGVQRNLVDEWVDTGQQQHPLRDQSVKLPVGERILTSIYIDYASDVWVKSQKFDHDPGEQFLQIDGGTKEGGFSRGIFYREKPFYGVSSIDDAHAARAKEIRRLPEGLFRLALERPETLEWVRVSEEGARRFDVVSVTDTIGARTFLYIDTANHLLAKSEFLRDHPVLGDTSADVVYGDYRKAGQLLLPFSYVDRIGGIPTHIMRAESIDVSANEPAELIRKPGHFVRTADPPPKPTLNARGNGVYEILGPYNVMFAVFRDFVLLIEAPVGESYVESCLGLIESVAPGKPIRAVATHFHYDHIGGARALVARDIPILTTADAKQVIEQQALPSRKTMRPDLYARQPKPPKIEVADEKTVFDDGTQRVEIYRIGPTEHVAEILVAYFPWQKTLHVADLWDVPTAEQPIAGNDAALLMRKMRGLGLTVDCMVPVHGVPANGDDLKRGLAIRAKYVPGETL